MSVRKFAWLLLFVWTAACSVDVVAEKSPVDVTTSTSVPEVSAPVTISESVTTTMAENSAPTVDDNIDVNVVETTTTISQPTGASPFSQAWIESSSLSAPNGLLEDARVQEEYWLNNPNTLSSPMGAFCWAYHEIHRAVWRLLRFDTLGSEIQWLMTELGITVAQVGEEGPDRNTAVLDILSEGANQDTAPVGSVEGDDAQTNTIEPGQDMTDEELARLLFYSDEYIETYRIENRIGGDGTEWYDALRAVADPIVVEATRSGDGLPTAVRPFADRFFETVNKLAVDTRPVTDDYYAADFFDAFSEEIPLPSDLVGFLEEAKYSQDCERAHLTILDYQ